MRILSSLLLASLMLAAGSFTMLNAQASPSPSQSPSPAVSPSVSPSPPALSAAEEAELLEASEGLVISANRFEQSIIDSAASVTIVKAKDAIPGSSNISDSLRSAPGIQVVATGADGATSSVRIRGASSEQTLYLINGVVMNSVNTGKFDLASYAMPDLERTEIVRGTGSQAYGSSGFGGSLNLVSKKPQKSYADAWLFFGGYLPKESKQHTGAGSSANSRSADALHLFENRRLGFNIATRLSESTGLAFFGSWDDMPHQFTFLQGNETYRRIGADQKKASLGSSFLTRIDNVELFVRGSSWYQDLGTPGSLPGYYTGRQTNWGGDGLVALDTDQLHLSIAGKTDGLTYVGWSYHHGRQVSLDATYQTRLIKELALQTGLSGSWQDLDSTNSAWNQRYNLGATVGLPIELQELTVTPSGRFEWYSDGGFVANGKLAAVLSLGEQDALRLSVASANRLPNFSQLYWKEIWYISDKNLLPETGFNTELGFRHEDKILLADAALFTRNTWNELADPYYAGLDKTFAKNIGQTFTPGLELSGTVKASQQLSINAAYTFLLPFILIDEFGNNWSLDNFETKPYTAWHTGSLGVKADLGASRFNAELLLSSERYSIIGREASDRQNATLGATAILNASVRHAISKDFDLVLSGRNLTDQQYEENINYPMPGLSLWVGVETRKP